ncbi:MAG: Rpn family recombination-promoting nuclease/putative transposase [Magnetococcales bacterium]|nr:Rpn family recombination-promoting nuclease/putative transposase [Magnetococcales bacterium]
MQNLDTTTSHQDADGIYHNIYAYPEMVADLLTSFLAPEMLAELDLSQMRRLNTKFTAAKGKRRRSDVVWEIPLRAGGHLYLLLILEFQSTIEVWMALRVCVYTGLLYQQLIAERKLTPEQGLPPVLPIILFNGKPRWYAATSLRDLIRLPDTSPLWHFQPDMRYYVMDEGAFPKDLLKSLPSLSAILFRLEHPTDTQSVVDAGQDLVEWFKSHPDTLPLKRLFRELLIGAMERVKVSEPLQVVPEELREISNMLADYIEQWNRDAKQQGWQDGKKDGRKEGESSVLLRQLRRRFPTLPGWVEQKVLDANLDALAEWTDRILDARSLQDIFGDDAQVVH